MRIVLDEDASGELVGGHRAYAAKRAKLMARGFKEARRLPELSSLEPKPPQYVMHIRGCGKALLARLGCGGPTGGLVECLVPYQGSHVSSLHSPGWWRTDPGGVADCP